MSLVYCELKDDGYRFRKAGPEEAFGSMPAMILDNRSGLSMILNRPIYDDGVNHILALDHDSEDRTIVSGIERTNPGNAGPNALLMVDLVTGERVILTK